MNKSEPISRPCLYKIAHNARSSRRASWPHHPVCTHDAGTVLHLLVLGQQGDRHLLNGNSQPRRCPVARRRVHDGDHRLGMGGGEAVKLQHDVNVIGHHQHLDLAAQAAQRERHHRQPQLGRAGNVQCFQRRGSGKRLELLRDLVPGVARIAVLVNPADAMMMETQLRDVDTAARAMGLHIQTLDTNTSAEIDAAFKA
jgi:hypothetical protein